MRGLKSYHNPFLLQHNVTFIDNSLLPAHSEVGGLRAVIKVNAIVNYRRRSDLQPVLLFKRSNTQTFGIAAELRKRYPVSVFMLSEEVVPSRVVY
jgi:hypothetical protein